jgi:hypothetical protein
MHSLTEIPDHLRYHRPESPLRRAFANVSPRYMLSKEDRLALLPPHHQQEHRNSPSKAAVRFYSPIRRFRDVEPRYNLPAPAAAAAASNEAAAVVRTDSDTEHLLRSHHAVVQRKFAHVLPRYSTNSIASVPSQISGDVPRSSSAGTSRGRLSPRHFSPSFRVGAAPPTAAETIRRNERLIEASRRGYQQVVHSSVGEYIRNGTPVKHAITAESRPVHLANRATSQKSSFVPSGGAGGGQWSRRANSPVSPPHAKEEAVVQRFVHQALHRQLSPGQIAPRVAYLSDAYVAQTISVVHSDRNCNSALPRAESSNSAGTAAPQVRCMKPAASSPTRYGSTSPRSSAPPENAREFSPPVRFHPR